MLVCLGLEVIFRLINGYTFERSALPIEDANDEHIIGFKTLKTVHISMIVFQQIPIGYKFMYFNADSNNVTFAFLIPGHLKNVNLE